MTHLDTRSVHAGRDDLTALGVHVPPIDLSTTYPLPGVDAGLTHRLVAAEAKPDQNLLRLSIGLEDPEDLTTDLATALTPS